MEIGETLLVTSRSEWRAWLAQHHRDRKEIWLIYYKKTSGKTGITYDESVEEALCFGWIDGANKDIDQETYAGRFTPRRAKSPWSDSNRERVARLLREGHMTEAGLTALPPDLRRALS
jgi:uncharacterized protein YdeI (YjbR/CyaY-like superfamily)